MVAISLALSILLLGTGCGLAEVELPDLSIDLADQLPSSWEPVGDLQEVNIDGDERAELLLFFRYSNSANGRGPIGAAIYDGYSPTVPPATDIESDTPNEIEASDPNLVLQMVGYRLLPRYWELERFEPLSVPADDVSLIDPMADLLLENTLPQYIAPPTFGSMPEVEVISDQFPFVVRGGELLIAGGSTHMTSAWWNPAKQDYQIAQAYASGGLENFRWSAPDQEGAVLAVDGKVNLNDRSALCRRYRFERRVFLESAVAAAARADAIDVEVDPQADEPDEAFVEVEVDTNLERDTGDRAVVAIQYEQRPLGIGFCGGIPQQPFYPEAVVLAYFLDAEERGYLVDDREGTPASDVLQAIFQQPGSEADDSIVDPERRVLDIRTRATMPGPNVAAAAAQDNPPTDASLLPVVCIDFLDTFERDFANEGGQVTERGTIVERRQLLFTLTYRVPIEGSIDDALRILNIRDVTGAVTGTAPCEALIRERPPELP